MKNKHNEEGFTIVEIAIVLLISGLVFSMIMAGYKTYITREVRNNTIEAIEESETAIFFHQVSYGAYPCPADPTLDIDNANFGKADCEAGALVRLIGRDADGDGNGDIVLMGAMPFRTLLDPDDDGDESDKVLSDYVAKYGHDSWGNKLTYVVTESLTNRDQDNDGQNDFAYDKDMGAIDVVDEGLYLNPDPIARREQATILEEWGTAHFAVLSHGPNSVGAYNLEGQLVQNCNLGLTVQEEDDKALEYPLQSPPDETENCENTDGDDATLLSGIYNGRRSLYNDDIVRFAVNGAHALWELVDAIYKDNGTPGDLSDDYYIYQHTNTNDGNVGVGMDAPTEKLDVNGDLQAYGIHADLLCDTDGTNCMDPEAIGGDLPEMRCGPGEVVVSIYKNSVQCASAFSASSFGDCEVLMGPGFALRGISTDGPICESY